MKRTPTRVALVVAVVLLLALGGLYAVRWWQDRDRTDLDRALAMAPSETQRYSWTDWAGVRAELGVETTADSSRAGSDRVEALLDRGFDADLTSTSALVESAADLQGSYGFSPLSARWELFSQSTQGMSVVVALDPEQVADVAEGLRALGYAEPSDDTGVWEGGDSTSPVVAAVTPVLLNVVLDADAGLLVGSDTRAQGLRAAAAAGIGDADAEDGDGAGPSEALKEAADGLVEPLSASLFPGEQACSELALGQADETDQQRGEALVAAAGPVDPLTAFAIGARPGGDVRVVMTFETDEQARTNADTRATLASGDAPGQGGTFAERFDLGRVSAEGDAVTMELEPLDGAYVLSDLATGPLLFATC